MLAISSADIRFSDSGKIIRTIHTFYTSEKYERGVRTVARYHCKAAAKGSSRRGRERVRASVNGRHLSCHVATASVSHPAICWYTRRRPWRRRRRRRRAGFPGSDCVTASRKPAEWLSLHGPNPSNCCQSAGCYIFSPATATEGETRATYTHSSYEKMRDEMSGELRRAE